MSVTSTTNRKSYSGDAVTTSFATSPVVFFDSSDLAVSVISALGVETALTENTHYTVSGGDGATGTVNLAGGSSPYGAPGSGTTLLILRVVPLTQPADLVNNDGSDAEVQERAYDRLTMMVQQLNEVDARAIKLPTSEAGSAALTELPVDRASKFLAFDASKNLIASSGNVAGSVPVSAFMETVLDDSTASEARTTLGAVGLTGDETIAGVKTLSSKPIIPAGMFTGHLHGFTLSNNGTDATNDIDIAAGSCRDSTDVISMTGTAMTKRLDAGWAPGSAAGFRNSGIAIANTTYHIYAVCKAGGADPDYYAHTSTTVATVITALQAETGGSEYLYARRIGSIVRVSAAIKAFLQTGDNFDWITPVMDISGAAATTSPTNRTLTVPTGLKLTAKMTLTAVATSTSNQFTYDPDLGALQASSTNRTLLVPNTTLSAPFSCLTNASARVGTSADGTNATITITTFGYIDTRGR